MEIHRPSMLSLVIMGPVFGMLSCGMKDYCYGSDVGFEYSFKNAYLSVFSNTTSMLHSISI